jgi:hypothetical protein
MGSQILFYVGLTLVVGPLLFIIVQAIKDYRKPSWQQDIHNRFMYYWNGTPDDEINAWYKVRYSLIQQGETQEKLMYIDKRIKSIDQAKYMSNTYVTAEGRWVEDRDIRPYQDA